MMMESEKRHRSRSSRREFLICFTSRFSSSSSASSMKISSKSIRSPGRTDKFREPTSLSSSLSRRLRSNGSLKGGQSSPMFPTGNKKRGSTFETPEPSSPKVTCIGQVRVKTKMQGKKMRTRSKRTGDVSFRKTEQTHEGIHQPQPRHQECLPHRNQRWVHVPLTICETLRGFGAEFNCFLPCRSSCFPAGQREKGEKTRRTSPATPMSSCGTFARWVMAVQEGEEKRREIGLVGGEERQRENRGMVDVIEIEEKGEVKEENEEVEEERVSICIPPKNALLLMRCRSDPVRMSSLANRFWDSPAPKEKDDDDDEDDRNVEGQGEEEEEEEEDEGEVMVVFNENLREEEMCEKWISAEAFGEPQNPQEKKKSEMEENPPAASVAAEVIGEETPETVVEVNVDKQNPEQEPQVKEEEILVNESPAEALEEVEKREKECKDEEQNSNLLERVEEEEDLDMQGQQQEPQVEEETMSNGSSPEPLEEQENTEKERENKEQEPNLHERIEEAEKEQRRTNSSSPSSTVSVLSEEEEEEVESEPAGLEEAAALEEKTQESTDEKETEERPSSEAIETTQERSETEHQPQNQQQKQTYKDEEEEKSGSGLPDCLMLMMCEPKLSMEVSKETWVCSTDFIRWHSQKPSIPKESECKKKRVGTDKKPPQEQPQQRRRQQLLQRPRKSCSNPAPPPAGSMAAMIEQKLVNAGAYEPFGLTRCKSEPMRNTAKLAQEACFWKNRKLEPHRPTTLGVGTAGIGF